LLLVAFLLVNTPNCHLSLVLASVVKSDAVNCNSRHQDNAPATTAIGHRHIHTKVKKNEYL